MSTDLYERLGSGPGISSLVDRIVDAHLVNPEINPRYQALKEDPDRMATAKRHLRDFLGEGSGGPEKYEGRSMLEIHRGMNIGESEYMAVLDDILRSLDAQGVDEATRRDVLAIAYSLKDEIVRV
ncbi:group 1 truncated hemoglobin [Aquisalimonas lutea]|uniref:group I truncated hemoglobin n=1 Tax=Aquisalimonas lutea TaxID=1327750 RepID=UPI0025B2E6B0|nr:group 1 truncated hemoglobin [Aquisalimonas lutea]MDN3518057.1 group 1 truncated hemoglobin [Aquisalimonas lutea]